MYHKRKEGGGYSGMFDVDAKQKWVSFVMAEVVLLLSLRGMNIIGGIY